LIPQTVAPVAAHTAWVGPTGAVLATRNTPSGRWVSGSPRRQVATGQASERSAGNVVDLGHASMCLCPEYRRRSKHEWLAAGGTAGGGADAGTWALLVLLARLPAGLLRDLASFVPDCV
jgi:hypothetical protein